MDFDLDPLSGTALYRQLADGLRALIIEGELSEGEPLPSERELRSKYGLARGTIRQALSLLKGEGLIETRRGQGAFVAHRPKVIRSFSDRFARRYRDQGEGAFIAEMREAGISEATVDSIVIEPRTIPPRDVAERLGLASNARVVKRSRRYLALGEPLQKAVSWIPLDLAKNTLIMQADTGPGGIYARLEERGIRLERFVEEIASRMPSPQESHELRVRPGIPVFVITRVAYDQDGRAVEVCETVARSDRYVLSYDLPAN